MRKRPEIRQINDDLHLSAQRIFDLHNNPDHGFSERNKDRLVDAENLVDAAINELLKLS